MNFVKCSFSGFINWVIINCQSANGILYFVNNFLNKKIMLNGNSIETLPLPSKMNLNIFGDSKEAVNHKGYLTARGQ